MADNGESTFVIKINVRPLLLTQFGIRYHRLRDTTGENIVICYKLSCYAQVGKIGTALYVACTIGLQLVLQ